VVIYQFVFFAVLLACHATAFALSARWHGSRRLAIALVVALPLAAAGLYYFKGTPAALDSRNVQAPKTIDELVVQLKEKVAANPDNVDAWLLLARSYMALEKFDLAADAYAHLTTLLPDDADVSVEYAEALMRASADRRFPPKAVAMLENAAAKNPQNQRALFFLGMHQMQSNQPAQAAATWEKILPMLTPDTAAALRKQIDSARSAANLPPLPEVASNAGPNLSINISIDPTLANLAAPGDTVYVFARGPDGKGPPLAAKRIVIDKLPLDVTLSDADSPMPAGKLSSQATVVVMARLSKSGNAQSTSGDVESDPATVTLAGAKPVSLMLNRAVP
jgi:cytochrome c-type biogenesis protein CcmH